eukprot:2882971-Prymnesium_polylepis.1
MCIRDRVEEGGLLLLRAQPRAQLGARRLLRSQLVREARGRGGAVLLCDRALPYLGRRGRPAVREQGERGSRG